MGTSTAQPFDAPDEHREFPLGVLDLITVGPLTFGRETLEPGWRWSTHVKPIDGSERCEFHHVGYQVSGRWICEDRDGTQIEVGPGDIYDTPPGHDAWVIGDEPCVCIDFQGIAEWAARGAAERVLTTVLFADVVDSTALIDRIGDAAWRRLQSQFFENVHSVLATHGGSLVDTAGDGILARFQSPAAAVRAASALIAAALRLDLGLRAGVNTGEVSGAREPDRDGRPCRGTDHGQGRPRGGSRHLHYPRSHPRRGPRLRGSRRGGAEGRARPPFAVRPPHPHIRLVTVLGRADQGHHVGCHGGL